jgi:NAD(P)H dehydrogenase (quinone)
MKALVVYCHPNPNSFNATVRDTVIEGLKSTDHEWKLVDLYADGFNPIMSLTDREEYHTAGANETRVRDQLELLRWCEALIFVYPTWWYGPPAMLKGWLDRVWVPHATFSMPEGNQPIRGLMQNIKHIYAISTLGSPWWWWKVGMGEPGRRMLLRGIGILCAPGLKTRWIALHKMDSSTDKERSAFLKRVSRAIRQLGK